MQSFYQAKASKSYHHKHEGELFIHSVEVAVNARMMAVQYNLPKRTQDCVCTGGLLHDIGKVLMHYNTGNDNKTGVNGQHESFSFMVLAEHLEKLKQQDKSLFEAMSAMLSAQVASRKHYDYIEEAIVRSADRLSAHSYELGTAFKNKPADQLFTSAHGGRKYKRLAPAQKIAWGMYAMNNLSLANAGLFYMRSGWWAAWLPTENSPLVSQQNIFSAQASILSNFNYAKVISLQLK